MRKSFYCRPIENTFSKIKNVVFLMRKSFFYRVINYAERFENASRPVSPGSVFQTAIYLGPLLPTASCDFFETERAAPWSLFVLLRVGFTGTRDVTAAAVGSYPTFPSLPKRIRRSISVALSLESPPPAVSRHPALRSPDFPHSYERDCPTYSHNPNYYKTTSPSCQTLKQLPPTNSLISELFGISSPGAARK